MGNDGNFVQGWQLTLPLSPANPTCTLVGSVCLFGLYVLDVRANYQSCCGKKMALPTGNGDFAPAVDARVEDGRSSLCSSSIHLSALLCPAHHGDVIARGPGRILGRFWRRETGGTGCGRLVANTHAQRYCTQPYRRRCQISRSYVTSSSCTFCRLLSNHPDTKLISYFFRCEPSVKATCVSVCLRALLTL